MKKTLVTLGIVIIVALAGWFGFNYFNFKSLQSQCYQKYNNADSVTTASFKVGSNFAIIQSIAADIQSSQNIKSASAVSANQALQNFKNAHAGDPSVIKAIGELNTNPLESTILITFASSTSDQDQSSTLDYLNQEVAKYNVSLDMIQQGLNQSQKDVILQRVSNASYNSYDVSYFKQCVNGLLITQGSVTQ